MPTIPSIRTSVENKDVLVLDEHSKRGTFLRDKRNRLISYSGGFTAVFPYLASNGEKWAFRCWHSDIGDVRQRMQTLSKELQKIDIPYFCDFEYVEQGLVVDGEIVPITRMKWVEGQNLKKYICSHRDKRKLSKLAEDFMKMCETLHARHIAHGDLQHENIIVDEKGKLALVDYDSVYMPIMGEQDDIVIGKPDYQHPHRKNNKIATERLDYFSELVIYLSIRAMAEDLTLIDKYKVEDSESLLFTKEDFDDWKNAPIVNEIKTLGHEFQDLLDILANYILHQDINDLEPFAQILFAKNVEFVTEATKIVKDKQIVKISWNVKDSTKAILSTDSGYKERLKEASNFTYETKLKETTIFYLTIVKDSFTLQKSIMVQVFEESKITFKADKLFVFPQIPILLSWKVKHAKQVWLNDEHVRLNDKKTVKQDKATTYILKVEDEFGIKEERICVNMLPVPQVKSLLVPTPHINNNLSVRIVQPQYNVSVEIPEITVMGIDLKVPKVPSLKDSGLMVDLSLPELKRPSLLKEFKSLFRYYYNKIKHA